jgi:hypothetical protein
MTYSSDSQTMHRGALGVPRPFSKGTVRLLGTVVYVRFITNSLKCIKLFFLMVFVKTL